MNVRSLVSRRLAPALGGYDPVSYFDDDIAGLFNADVPGHLAKADANWKQIHADSAR